MAGEHVRDARDRRESCGCLECQQRRALDEQALVIVQLRRELAEARRELEALRRTHA